jgi:hypothetical protein
MSRFLFCRPSRSLSSHVMRTNKVSCHFHFSFAMTLCGVSRPTISGSMPSTSLTYQTASNQNIYIFFHPTLTPHPISAAVSLAFHTAKANLHFHRHPITSENIYSQPSPYKLHSYFLVSIPFISYHLYDISQHIHLAINSKAQK